MDISLSAFLTKAKQANPPILADMVKPHISFTSFLGRLFIFCFLFFFSVVLLFPLFSPNITIMDVQGIFVLYAMLAIAWIWWFYIVFFKKYGKRKIICDVKNPTFFYDMLVIIMALIIMTIAPFFLFYNQDESTLLQKVLHIFGCILIGIRFNMCVSRHVLSQNGRYNESTAKYNGLLKNFIREQKIDGLLLPWFCVLPFCWWIIKDPKGCAFCWFFYAASICIFYFTSIFRQRKQVNYFTQNVPIFQILSLLGIKADPKNDYHFVLKTPQGNVSFFKTKHMANPFGYRDYFADVVDFYLPMKSKDILDHSDKLCRICNHFVWVTSTGKDLFLLKKDERAHALISVNEERKTVIVTSYIQRSNSIFDHTAYHYYTEEELKQIYTEISEFQRNLEEVLG